MNPVKLITPTSLEFISLTEAKAHLKVTSSDEDTLIQTYLNGAIQRVENYRQSNIMSAEFELYAPYFDYNMNLQKHPVTAINSVKYYDEDNVLQTVSASNYRLHDFRVPARLEFDEDYYFPDVYDREYPVVINFQAGFTYAASAQYQNIKVVTLGELGTINEIRQSEMVGMGLAGIQMKNISMQLLDAESMWL